MENTKKLLIEFLEWAEMECHIDTFSDYEYIVDNFIKEGMAKPTPETRNCNLSDVSKQRELLEIFYKRMVGREEMHDSDEYFMDEIMKIFQ